ncbi:unnamed protein product [Effrenium voratum]|nr:unnamed protein product [Effrenium voratum]
MEASSKAGDRARPQGKAVPTPAQAREREPVVATPLRRRSVSPVPGSPQTRQLGHEQPPNVETKEKLHMSAAQKFGLLAGVAMLAFACLRPSKPVSKPEAASTSRFTAEPEPEAVPSLVSLTKRALDCPNSRADVLDVLAGAPYEFSTEENQEGFFRLPHLAAAAARGKDLWGLAGGSGGVLGEANAA